MSHHVLSNDVMLFIEGASDQPARNKAFRKAHKLLMTIAEVLPQNAKTKAERLSKTLRSKSIPIDFDEVIEQAKRSQQQARGCLVSGILIAIVILFIMFTL